MTIYSLKMLSQQIIEQRKKHKLSQTDVGRMAGLKQKMISAFENRPENIKLETFFYILSALNLEIKLIDKIEKAKSESKWEHVW